MTEGTWADGGAALPHAARAPLACVVVNPSKHRVTPAVRERLTTALLASGHGTVHWLETSPAETGATQARLAVASGASSVVAVGGDGTARAVAAGVAGTGAALGIVPLGTANLAARNLGLPLGDLGALIDLAASGEPRPADLAWVRTVPADGEELAPAAGWARPTLGSEHACLVVTGIGFDAGLVASTSPRLKARMRWGAYAVAALGNLRSPRMRLRVRIDGGAPDELRARTLLIANGGRLPAGITLVQGASMDDGALDVAAIDTVGGLAGWTSLARQVLPPFPATYSDPERSLGRVRLNRAREVRATLDGPALVEVDGELLAPAREVRVRLDSGALLIRRP